RGTPLVAGRPAYRFRFPGRGRALGHLDDRCRGRLSESADTGFRRREHAELVARWPLRLLCLQWGGWPSGCVAQTRCGRDGGTHDPWGRLYLLRVDRREDAV